MGEEKHITHSEIFNDEQYNPAWIKKEI